MSTNRANRGPVGRPSQPRRPGQLGEYLQWCDSHCYHCGRTLESIEAEGPTPNCLCSDEAAEAQEPVL